MTVKIDEFGKARDGQLVYKYSLVNANGCRCSLLSYGAAIQELVVPDRDGCMADVVLGFDDLAGYEGTDNPYFGAVIGRHCNRIEDASFTLDGKTYQLARNDGRNHLHGGPGGFAHVVFEGKVIAEGEEPAVAFSYFSPDNEEGYPGNLTTIVTYTLTRDNGLKIDYDAVADKITVINLTNHAYFNLAGHDKGSIIDHVVCIEADNYTVANEESLPNGTIASVKGTALDFTEAKAIGRDIGADEEQLRFGNGYDHNYVLRQSTGALKRCATVYEPDSGRVMTVYTTLPGLQLYSGNMMKSVKGKGGATYDRRHGLCLETQFFPNSLRHSNFLSPIFKAGEHFRHSTLYTFSSHDETPFTI